MIDIKKRLEEINTRYGTFPLLVGERTDEKIDLILEVLAELQEYVQHPLISWTVGSDVKVSVPDRNIVLPGIDFVKKESTTAEVKP